jgi:flagellar biosynthesis protein
MSEPGKRIAVALRYELGADDLPTVTAKGHGSIAERIVEAARQHGVPIREDRDLVAVLAALDVGRPIPPVAFLAVAEILACLYRHNARLAAAHADADVPG